VWSVQYDSRVEGWLETIPSDIKARILRIIDLLIEQGPSNVREPYVKHLKGHGKLYEIRAQGKDGIARVFYFIPILIHAYNKAFSSSVILTYFNVRSDFLLLGIFILFLT
jgi:hypothetical protein